MSQYERRRRGNALPGNGPRFPSGGNTRAGRRGSGHLAVSLGYLGGRLDKTGDMQMTALGDEAVGKPGVAGVYTNQRLSLSTTWEGPRKKAKVSNRTREIWPSGIIGGRWKTCAMVRL